MSTRVALASASTLDSISSNMYQNICSGLNRLINIHYGCYCTSVRLNITVVRLNITVVRLNITAVSLNISPFTLNNVSVCCLFTVSSQ